MLTEANRKWWVLIAMTSCISMIFIDVTVLPVALPTIRRDLSLSDLGVQWIINAYTLTISAFVLAGGRLADMWGNRRIYCFGVTLFILASLLCGVSQGEMSLVFFRVLQGLGGALLLPATQSILVDAFPPHERGKAIGIYVSIGSIFLSVGPMIGGAFTQYLTWRYVFLINVPIGMIGMLLALYSVKKAAPRKESFDFLGSLTIAFGISCLIIAMMEGQEWGWLSVYTLSFLIAGLFSLFLLIYKDRQVEHPLVDFSLFRHRSLRAGVLGISSAQIVIILGVFWAIYLQTIIGYTPVSAGIMTFLANLPVFIIAPLAGHLVDRIGPRLPVSIGYLMLIGAVVWFLFFPRPELFWQLLPFLVLFGCGVPLVMTPSFVTLMRDVPPTHRGSASGINATMRQFSATFGMALFGTLFFSHLDSRFAAALKRNPITTDISPSAFEGMLDKTPEALAALSNLPSNLSYIVTTAYTDAYVSSFILINIVGMGIAILSLILILPLFPSKK